MTIAPHDSPRQQRLQRRRRQQDDLSAVRGVTASTPTIAAPPMLVLERTSDPVFVHRLQGAGVAAIAIGVLVLATGLAWSRFPTLAIGLLAIVAGAIAMALGIWGKKPTDLLVKQSPGQRPAPSQPATSGVPWGDLDERLRRLADRLEHAEMA